MRPPLPQFQWNHHKIVCHIECFKITQLHIKIIQNYTNSLAHSQFTSPDVNVLSVYMSTHPARGLLRYCVLQSPNKTLVCTTAQQSYCHHAGVCPSSVSCKTRFLRNHQRNCMYCNAKFGGKVSTCINCISGTFYLCLTLSAELLSWPTGVHHPCVTSGFSETAALIQAKFYVKLPSPQTVFFFSLFSKLSLFKCLHLFFRFC